ncbi:hypothetical protein CBM2615_A210001 [Cupriavidus taiwanensis]|uniref:Uncharacterized protein n=1 Tax=Cupriavidus taiwanensis TaxID=164546 RepID=A0A375DY56_9BURK|nr:hypothetical protein CBM2615_A210001 [Cupriavidus taiwanensis]SOZ56115.1 hypothetical protein CBM2613_A210001 [Cupriavidus taiwanensis]SPA04511.1 hypothetical protein CBM2625_A160001 [Cupriavidus taiwanensis]
MRLAPRHHPCRTPIHASPQAAASLAYCTGHDLHEFLYPDRQSLQILHANTELTTVEARHESSQTRTSSGRSGA